jgi:microcystin degradation protein MlrC
MTWAQPGGVTVRSAYESLRDEILADLKSALPVDAVLLNLHGAMVADGYDDCEEDLIRRVRALAGPHAIIGVELDLHCHLSESKIEAADIVITYKEYPHVDINERGRELFDLVVATRLGKCKPVMALFDCRMIGLYATTREPMRGFVDSMIAAEQRERVLSVSFAHDFQFADVPHLGAKVLVVADGDAQLAQKTAREVGNAIYQLRREIGMEVIALPLEHALSRALESPRAPVVVADQSDNVGGGAPGDATFALRWLLDNGVHDVALAIFYDPEVVRIAMKAGVGATVAVRLGGKLGPSSGNPVDLTVTVLAIREGYQHAMPQESGEPWWYPVGDAVALKANGIEVIVGSELGIEERTRRALIVKSAQHFHAAFKPLASEIIYMAGPGAVPPDPRLVRYQRVDTARLYPWNDDPLAM